MKTVQIRNVPDEVHQTLRERAAADGVSLSDYLLRQLERVAARPEMSDVLLRAEQRDGRIPFGEATAMIRAGRGEI